MSIVILYYRRSYIRKMVNDQMIGTHLLIALRISSGRHYPKWECDFVTFSRNLNLGTSCYGDQKCNL